MKTFLSVLGWALGYYVATLASLFLGALHPFLWVYGSLTCVVLAAWPYCRLVNRYPYMGMALLVTVLSIGINLALGEGDLLYVCLALGIALVAEGVRRVGGYQSLNSQTLGYMVMSLLPFSNTLRMWFNYEECMEITLDEMGPDYAEKMTHVLSPWLLAGMVLLTLLLALVMSLICNRKQCQEALLRICGHPEMNWLSSLMLRFGMNYGHRMLSDYAFSKLALTGKETDVLDIGCGGGYNIGQFLKHLPKAMVQGLDYSQKSVETSLQYNRKAFNQGRCLVRQGNVAELPYEAESFDVVSAFETIYFWPNIQDCFRGIHRILRPQGRFMVVGDMPELAKQWSQGSPLMRVYTIDGVKSMMEKAGFSDIQVHNTSVVMCIIATK